MFSVQPLIVAALLSQLGLVVGSCSSADYPKNHLTKEDHPELYAAKVTRAEVMNKPLDHAGSFKIGLISHSGVLVTLDGGPKKLLIQKIECGAALHDPAVMEGVQWETISEMI
ncbi:unnamed protein product [Arctogadus glacialis]